MDTFIKKCMFEYHKETNEWESTDGKRYDF